MTYGQGTHNAIAFHEEDYLELLSVRDRDEYLARNPGGGLLDFLARVGFRYVAVQSDDLVADVAQMRQRGVDVSEPACRRAPDANRPGVALEGRDTLVCAIRCRFSSSSTSRRCTSDADRRLRLARIPTGCSASIACTSR